MINDAASCILDMFRDTVRENSVGGNFDQNQNQNPEQYEPER